MYRSLFNAGSPPTAEMAVPADPADALDSGMKALFRALRVADPYGANPHHSEPYQNTPYNPHYIALLYLRLETNWSMVVNHAYYEVPAGDTPQHAQARLDRATEIFEKKLAESVSQHRDVQFGELQGAYQPTKHQTPALPYHPEPLREYDSGSLRDFKFLSQNEIFIFIHHPSVAIKLVPGDLIGFSAKWTTATATGASVLTVPNDAFFNAAEVLNPGPADTKLIRIRNYATNTDGLPIPAGTPLDYSMDIKFQIHAGSAGWVTMIVDPDTGNGTGYEP
jgi:hypothetical protein